MGGAQVTLRPTEWRGGWARATTLALVISVIPLPLAAEESRPAGKTGPIKASIEKIAVKDTTNAHATRAVAKRSQSTSPTQGGSFFKSKPGLIALAVMAAGAGYALYSAKNDRITSPGKE
jgi:hypothetical protein